VKVPALKRKANQTVSLEQSNALMCMRVYFRRDHTRTARGFTLMDVLVSIIIIAVLMGLLLPSLNRASETARRVSCQSNVRQIGLAIVMYADDFGGYMPVSVFLHANTNQRGNDRPQNMSTLLLPEAERLSGTAAWDGLGVLFANDYLSAPRVFYCPSHTGDHPFSRYTNLWSKDDFSNDDAVIVANYHYRGAGPGNGIRSTPGSPVQNITTNLYRIDPAQSSLVSDGMRVASDYNHKMGVNFFRADLTTHWFADTTGQYRNLLPVNEEDFSSRLKVEQAWGLFDMNAVNGGTVIAPNP